MPCVMDLSDSDIVVVVFLVGSERGGGAGGDRTRVHNAVEYIFYKLSPFGRWGRWLGDLPPLSLYAAELRWLLGLFLPVERAFRGALCPHLLGCGKLTLHEAVEGEDCVGFLKGRSELVGVCFYLF